MTTVTALLLDLSNILGGLVLAAALLGELPRVGDTLSRLTRSLTRAGVVIGVVALAVGGYYLIAHVTTGPHVFHFELVGIGVGVALLRERLFPGVAATPPARSATGRGHWIDTRQPAPAPSRRPVTGMPLLLAVFGLIAIVVGIQGLLTPDS